MSGLGELRERAEHVKGHVPPSEWPMVSLVASPPVLLALIDVAEEAMQNHDLKFGRHRSSNVCLVCALRDQLGGLAGAASGGAVSASPVAGNSGTDGGCPPLRDTGVLPGPPPGSECG